MNSSQIFHINYKVFKKLVDRNNIVCKTMKPCNIRNDKTFNNREISYYRILFNTDFFFQVAFLSKIITVHGLNAYSVPTRPATNSRGLI